MNLLVKRNDYPFFSDLNKLWVRPASGDVQPTFAPPVNIVETNDDFRIEIAAPGMRKQDFRAELTNNYLTVWAKSADDGNDSRHYIRREFQCRSFKRSFYLPNTLEREHIEGKYQDGILRLLIPKKDEIKAQPVKSIVVM